MKAEPQLGSSDTVAASCRILERFQIVERPGGLLDADAQLEVLDGERRRRDSAFPTPPG